MCAVCDKYDDPDYDRDAEYPHPPLPYLCAWCGTERNDKGQCPVCVAKVNADYARLAEARGWAS